MNSASLAPVLAPEVSPSFQGLGRAAAGLERHAALSGLAGTDLSRRFCYWRGASGRRYLFSVFPVEPQGGDRCPRFEDAVVLAVAHGPDGARRVLGTGESGRHADLYFEGYPLHDATAAGANEIHVHLLATDAAGRMDLIRDLLA